MRSLVNSCSTLDQLHDGHGKTKTLVGDLEYVIPTKLHHYQSNGSREEVENEQLSRTTQKLFIYMYLIPSDL